MEGQARNVKRGGRGRGGNDRIKTGPEVQL
jgi:hypothetical protein